MEICSSSDGFLPVWRLSVGVNVKWWLQILREPTPKPCCVGLDPRNVSWWEDKYIKYISVATIFWFANEKVLFFLLHLAQIWIQEQLLTWVTFVYLVPIIRRTMSSSQPARSAAWLTSRLSLGGSNPVVFPGKTPGCCRRRSSLFLSLPLSSSHLSVSLQSCRVNWQHWESSVSAAGCLCTETVAGELKTFTGRIRVHRNGSLLLFASADKPGLHLKILLSFFLFFFVFLLSVFLSVRSPRLVLRLQLSRQLTARWQVLRMGGWEAAERGRKGD